MKKIYFKIIEKGKRYEIEENELNYLISFGINLEKRINKAIEWVNNHIETYTQNGIGIIDWDHNSDPRKLLDILKGSDNND